MLMKYVTELMLTWYLKDLRKIGFYQQYKRSAFSQTEIITEKKHKSF